MTFEEYLIEMVKRGEMTVAEANEAMERYEEENG